MKIKITLINVLVLLITSSSLVLARGEMPPPHQMIEKLKLTAQQQQQMQLLHEKQKGKFKNSMDRIKSLHDQLDQELLKNKPDEVKINNIISKIKIIQIELIDNHFEQILATRKILTQQQFKTMLDLRRDLPSKIEKKIRHRKDFPHEPKNDRKKGKDVPPPPFLP